jgi:hypothetical protein
MTTKNATVQRTHVFFLNQTGSVSVEAYVAPTVTVRRILPKVLAKMNLPRFGPDGREISYSLDHKEGGRRLRDDETLPEANVQDGDHLIVYPEIVAGSLADSLVGKSG